MTLPDEIQILCPHCGTLNERNAKVCSCGFRLKQSSAPAIILVVLLLALVCTTTAFVTSAAAYRKAASQYSPIISDLESQVDSLDAQVVSLNAEVSAQYGAGYDAGYDDASSDTSSYVFEKCDFTKIYYLGLKSSSDERMVRKLHVAFIQDYLTADPTGALVYNYGYENGYNDAKSGYVLYADDNVSFSDLVDYYANKSDSSQN